MSATNFIAEPGKLEVILTHTFNAPRELVFKAYTDPKHIPNWWGPKVLTTTVEKMEVKPGGIWRIIQVAPDGTVHGFHGVYHSVAVPERIVYTFEYEGAPGHVILKSVSFEEEHGKTKLIDQSIFQSIQSRDAMNSGGAEKGARESMERLTELLASYPA